MGQITEEERLQLENEALRRIVQYVASLPTDVESYSQDEIQGITRRARNLLTEVKGRRKGVAKIGDVERIAVFVVENAKRLGIKDPCVVFERIKRSSWEAYLGDHDESIGIGYGRTAFEAVLQLLNYVKVRR